MGTLTRYHRAYIGLGSNLASPRQQICRALQALAMLDHSRNLCDSRWYGSQAIGPGNQPDYVNTVALIETRLSPFTLLHQLQNIENRHGRQRNVRWGARTLDLDLLLYDDSVIRSEELQLPHPEIYHRHFVLYPLYDLAPELVFPDGQSLASMINPISMTDLYPIDKYGIEKYSDNPCE